MKEAAIPGRWCVVRRGWRPSAKPRLICAVDETETAFEVAFERLRAAERRFRRGWVGLYSPDGKLVRSMSAP